MMLEKYVCAWSVLSSFKAVCDYFVEKNADRDQNCSFDLMYFQR